MPMDLKPRPNHDLYIRTMRAMTPAQRLAKAFELSDLSRRMLESAVRRANPGLSEEAIKALVVERLDRCRNSNF